MRNRVFNKLFAAVPLLALALLVAISPPSALAQSSSRPQIRVVAACGTPPYTYTAGNAEWQLQDVNGNICTAASVSASITGFPTNQTTGTPFTATTGGATGTLPTGAVVVVSNVGATNAAYCKLGASATTSDQLIAPQSWFAFTVGVATQLTCITGSSTTAINMVGGSGIPTGAGGGGGSGTGGAVTNAGTFAVQNTAATPAGTNIIGKVSTVDSGGTDATDTTNHAIKVNVVAGGAGGGAVYGPTAVGSAAANPPVLMAGTANAGATGNVQVAKVDTSGNVYVKGVGVAAGDATSGVTYSPTSYNAATACNGKSYTNGQQEPADIDLKGNTCANIAALGGTAIDTNSGNKSAGTQRQVLATDSPSIANYGQGATAAAVPAGAVYIGGNAGGNLTGMIACDSSAVYDASTNGSTQLVGLVSSKIVYVCGYSIFSAGTANVELDYGTGTACATGNNKIVPAFQLTAQTGVVDGSPYFRGLKTAASNELCLKTSAGVAVQAIVYYTQF